MSIDVEIQEFKRRVGSIPCVVTWDPAASLFRHLDGLAGLTRSDARSSSPGEDAYRTLALVGDLVTGVLV